MRVLYLDESGDHSLARIDPQYPVFVLGGVLFESDVAVEEASNAVASLKTEFFGRANVVLHTADIIRCRGPFESLKEAAYRDRFLNALTEVVRGSRFKVIAAAIKKNDHLARYGAAALDPYMLCLDLVLERFIFELGTDRGAVIAESRGPTLDHQLELAWLNLKIQGTRYVDATRVRDRIEAVNIRNKQSGLVGLEFADLVVSPIGRHVIGKPPRPDWTVVSSKLRRSPTGATDGWGLVVMPKR